MLAAVLHGQTDLRLGTVPDPIPGPGEVVIQVDIATTCGTDLKVWRRGGHAKMLQPPILFGHEAAGQIVALGKGVEGWSIGDRVVANNSAPCMKCFYCQRHEYSLCTDLTFNNGTFAQYQRIPAAIVEHNLLSIPEQLSTAAASLTEPLACVLHGISRSSFHAQPTQRDYPPQQVVVIGDGAIGLMFVGVLAHRGAQVILCGGSDERLQLGQRLGATDVFNHHHISSLADAIHPLTQGRGADIVIEATGVPKAWETAITCGRPGATINLFGGCPRDAQITVNTDLLHYSELTLKGVFHNTPAFVRESLDLLDSQVLPFELLLNDTQPLENLEQVFVDMRDRKTIKAIITPHP